MKNEQIISHVQAKVKAKVKAKLSEYDRNMINTTIDSIQAIQRDEMVKTLGPNRAAPKPKKSIFYSWPVQWLAAGFIAAALILILIGFLFLKV